MDNDPKQRLTVVPASAPEDAVFVDCSFRGIDESRAYPVATSEWERIQYVLDSERKAFLGLDTLDGRSVFISLQHLQYCRLATGPYFPSRPILHALVCQLIGTKPALELPDLDVEWAPNIAMSLEEFGNLGERFVQVPDEVGGIWAINLADIIYLEFPAVWHDEAMEAWEEMEAEMAAKGNAKKKRATGTQVRAKKKAPPKGRGARKSTASGA